jgi:hypothetical protein
MTIFLLGLFWVAFYALYRAFPYIKNGSDLVFQAKLNWESKGSIFPAASDAKRVLIFGNSKILAGFLPGWFDALSASDQLKVSSFNSGFPGSDLLLPPLEAMCHRGQAPNVLLLTLPWDADPEGHGIFHFLPDDHAAIDRLFPFRYFLRDLTAFLLAAPSHGGVLQFYRESEENERAVIAARGYHLITEQSRFPGGRLPDDFRLASDRPTERLPREAPVPAVEASRLHELIRQYHIDCYYVPLYFRSGEFAPAASRNAAFSATAEEATSCKVLGPDYYLYPNAFFADQTHLNEAGARVYTQALFELLKDRLHAFQ